MGDQPVVYDVGDTVTLGVEINNAAGSLANAGSVTLTVILPDGTTTSPLVSNPSTGIYNAALVASQIGTHVLRWVATGANAAAFSDSFTVRDGALIPCVSLEEIKTYLGVTTTTSDEELRTFLDAATARGEAETGRVFGRRTVTHEWTAPSGMVTFPGVPILSITSVTDDGATLTAADYLLWKHSGVIKPVGAWAGDVTVTAVCGYTAPPAPLRQGVMEMTRHLWQTQRGTLKMGIGEAEWSPVMSFALPRRVEELWSPWRIPGFG